MKILKNFIKEDIFTQEDEPRVYIYRLATENHTQTGVVACCSLDEYESGNIKKHEKTRPDKVEDRTAHMLALRAQSGLIFLTFRGTEETHRLISETVQGKPLYDFGCFNKVRQTVWRVKETEDFIKAFEEVPALYVADGHHRVESAKLARENFARKKPESHRK